MKNIFKKIVDFFNYFIDGFEFFGSILIVLLIGAFIYAFVGMAIKTKECTDLIQPPDKEIIKEVVYIYSER